MSEQTAQCRVILNRLATQTRATNNYVQVETLHEIYTKLVSHSAKYNSFKS